MTIKQMAQSAIDVQSACNLSGVARTFADITSAMRMEHKMDTPTCNRHPVCRLFAEQIAHLTGTPTDSGSDYTTAYDECTRLAEQ